MPEEGSLVVVNATPIISLSLAGHLDLLRHLYQEVLIPPAVRAEVLAGGRTGRGVEELKAADWVRTVPLQDPRRADLLSDLHRGEAEVIALAQEIGASLVILDERLARRHALRLGLTITGTVGVFLKAKEKGLVPRIEPLIERILNHGIHLSPDLVHRALRLAGER
ncbi:MAG TPA: DUF3368 domain-containing protein [Thermoanaerobaculia bacterium]|nr:DUF3368 domain-containing protein [Thermoanaerobaculia bacterium]